MAAGEWRRWMVLVATIWIQAFTGTNLDFSSYSTQLKLELEISQVKLNYLSMASDFGKAFGWCSGVLLLYFPAWVVLFMAAFLGLFGYGLQWLLIQRIISLPYSVVFLLCLSAGCSISWFNTVCFVLCIKNFPANRPLAICLSLSFNGVSAALYNLIANTINSNDNAYYLLLNALIPFITSITAVIPIFQQPSSQKDFENDDIDTDNDRLTFLFLYTLAAFTGLYLLLLDTKSQNLLVVAVFLLVLPLMSPGIVYACTWAHTRLLLDSRVPPLEGPSFNLVSLKDWEFHGEFMEQSEVTLNENSYSCWIFEMMLWKDRLMVLGEEHSAKSLVSRCDFWLYYTTYFCGGTIGLVYSNNLGQISQSLGHGSETTALVTLFSACSFFGRLMSAAPDFVGCFHLPKTYTARYTKRTGWLALLLVPMPIAFLLVLVSGTETALSMATGLIGLSSGFITCAAVSLTSELFGPDSTRINHNILITNIPLGSLFYGLLAALVYDNHIESSKVCMGRRCFYHTFAWWGGFSLLGLASGFLLFLRTRAAYERFERMKIWNRFSEDPALVADGD